MKNKIINRTRGAGEYIAAFARWIAVSAVTGLIGGFIGAMFHMSIAWATGVRADMPWILWFMPLGGVIIALLYRGAKMQKNGGTNSVINSAVDKERVPFLLAPLIFISTVITHLVGGSSGREGAALQLGGSIGEQAAKIFRLGGDNRKVVVMCGMASVFSALFGTPAAAAVFALEVANVGVMHYAGLVPCMVASISAAWMSGKLGVVAECFTVDIPTLGLGTGWRVCLLAMLAAAVSILFCVVMKNTGKLLKKGLKNDYLRAAVGGFAVIALTLLVGNQRYNGGGMNVVASAIEGEAYWFDFLLKLLFTAITIGTGFKGGEIVPTFFVGATFGCVAGGLLGLDAGFGAAIGMIALFCGVVNCPIASCLLAVELFGGSGVIYFALAVAISYMLSGYYGLYSSQHFEFSKLGAVKADRWVK